ncbi:MAG TPA: Rieske (2Fe-2S) protein [Calditrichaeota bacterium]|nr:Rieske (2Fe-2S) protein [Calditrichota bacterium]
MAQNENKQSRRDFIRNTSVLGALIIAIGTFVRHAFVYLLPEKKKKTYHKYLVAKKSELPVGKAKKIALSGKPVYVVRLDDGYKVFSGVCTHLGCIVRWEEQKGRFYCPCHQGIFSKTGEVLGGPPPRPLDEFEVHLEQNLVFIKVEDKMEGPWT